MNRQEIETLSKNLTSEYGGIMTAVLMNEVEDRLVNSTALSLFYYVKIDGLSAKWLEDEKEIFDYMSGFFVGAYSLKCTVSVIFKEERGELSLFVGTQAQDIEALIGLLRGCFPVIELQKGTDENNYSIQQFNQIYTAEEYSYGGYLKGNPSRPIEKNGFPLYQALQGMHGRDWCFTIFAVPEKTENTITRHELWMAKLAQCGDLLQVSYSEQNSNESVTYVKSYEQCKRYNQLIEQFTEKLDTAIVKGEWYVSANFSAKTLVDSQLLGALLTSSYFGKTSTPEPVHSIFGKHENVVLPNSPVMTYYTKYLQYPKYANFLNSEELGILTAFPTKETYGLSVNEYIEFSVDRENEGDLEIGSIVDANEVTDNKYSVDVNGLNRHCLVAGLTGSGKTNTLKNLLWTISDKHRLPFLIIEPAKKEYWELYKLGISNLQIYSVGSNEKNSCRLCLNPFERVGFTDPSGVTHRVPIQTHIDFVFAAFKASFIMYTPMPYILEKAIYEIYEDVGWDIHNDCNDNGEIYPTMEDLFFKIEDVVNANGYDTKMRRDLIGSLQARVNSMRLGTKGDTLNVARTFPFEQIMNGNVIIELEDIGDDDVKAFIISIILILLLEYRRQQPDSQLELKHILLIEEAHRLLKNVQSGTGENADPRGAAVEFFCNLLAELRSKGQGFIVADQIPSKLAPDLIKNTNLKIVHRTVAEEERILLGGAMHMTDKQVDYLASLRQGIAAVYSEGDDRPILVKSNFAGERIVSSWRDFQREDVLERTRVNGVRVSNSREYSSLTGRQNRLCWICDRRCEKKYSTVVQDQDRSSFMNLVNELNPYRTKKCKGYEIDARVKKYLTEKQSEYFAEDIHNRICVVNNLIDEWNLESEYVHVIEEYYATLTRRGRG